MEEAISIVNNEHQQRQEALIGWPCTENYEKGKKQLGENKKIEIFIFQSHIMTNIFFHLKEKKQKRKQRKSNRNINKDVSFVQYIFM